MTRPADSASLRGLVFTRQFPNPSQPHRGTFVVEQMRATDTDVAWRAIAPVPWVPRALSGVSGRPYVTGPDTMFGWHVDRPRYPVLPRRALYATVSASMARASAAAFARALERHRPDFVHAHELYPSGAAAVSLAGRTGVPVIVTVHGSDLYSNLAKPSWTAALCDAASRAAAVVCVGTQLAEDCVRELGIAREHVRVIPDAFDDGIYAPYVRETHGGPTRLLSIGRLVPEKGHDLLLEAVARIITDGSDIELQIVGGGALEGDLRVKAAALSLGDHVRFLGALTGEAMLAAMHRADLYVQASRREGFGLALVEAMATGLPAVATDSGGPGEILTPETGVLVVPGRVDALAEGIEQALDRLGTFDPEAISRSVTARFGRAAVGAQLLGLYRDVAGGKGASDG
ncbi:MAG: glycosyltransferase [Actinomycetota bacterium]|nr:glycosyltransferase [Actinomycetota bacterium]